MYIVDIPESDEKRYFFTELPVIRRSIDITWGKQPLLDRPVIIQAPPTKHGSFYNIKDKDGKVIGTIQYIDEPKLINEPTHF